MATPRPATAIGQGQTQVPGKAKTNEPTALKPAAMQGGRRRERSVPYGQPPSTLSTYEVLDRTARAQMAALTFGIAPTALAAAFHDWAAHLAEAPGKRLDLAHRAMSSALAVGLHGMRLSMGQSPSPPFQPAPTDHRFAAEPWRPWPFGFFVQSFLAQEAWWQDALTNVPGVTGAHERVTNFVMRQIMDTLAPANFLPTNPEVQIATIAQGGANLIRGAGRLAADLVRQQLHEKPPALAAFEVGRNLAITPGEVVYRNRLIELIRYAPATPEVHPEPILIVPAWIMKYYILDLSPRNSFVRYLVSRGFTVFMISWLNPGAEDRDLGMEDYLEHGILDAMDAVRQIAGDWPIHALGYCLGGTLLAIAAAALGRDGKDCLASVVLLAAQTDFTEAGELTLFINEAQVSFLEDMMWEQGFLSTDQMGGTFRLLRSADLIWSKNVRSYLLGEAMVGTDLLAWNADGTRLPARMHSQYLRQLFLKNALAEGRYHVGSKPVTISDIRVPLFVVGTEEDHVAPWRSVYKIHLMADTAVTFVLASGGHNGGIVAPPGRHGLHYRIATTPAAAPYCEDHDWFSQAPVRRGSWWSALATWLEALSGPRQAPPPLSHSLLPGHCPAPGTYVLRP